MSEPTSKVTLKTVSDTVLKPRPVPASELESDELRSIKPGEVFEGAVVYDHSNGHSFVHLPLPAAPRHWWIFDDHWSGLHALPGATATAAARGAEIRVPYFSQRDNYRDASRTCFSSSCAMLLAALKPGVIAGDDDYIREVFKHGDSTDAAAQLKALAHFGLAATYHQDGSIEDLKAQLDAGKPQPIGILHHGPCSAPCGGGHWICVIGYRCDASAPGGGYFIVHDPWGELDNASGVYIGTAGKGLHYSFAMIKARWTVAGPRDGWHIKA